MSTVIKAIKDPDRECIMAKVNRPQRSLANEPHYVTERLIPKCSVHPTGENTRPYQVEDRKH